jgi:hypothetical protein
MACFYAWRDTQLLLFCCPMPVSSRISPFFAEWPRNTSMWFPVIYYGFSTSLAAPSFSKIYPRFSSHNSTFFCPVNFPSLLPSAPPHPISYMVFRVVIIIQFATDKLLSFVSCQMSKIVICQELGLYFRVLGRCLI